MATCVALSEIALIAHNDVLFMVVELLDVYSNVVHLLVFKCKSAIMDLLSTHYQLAIKKRYLQYLHSSDS